MDPCKEEKVNKMVTNNRKAKCRSCGKILDAGKGYWYKMFSGGGYYCKNHHPILRKRK